MFKRVLLIGALVSGVAFAATAPLSESGDVTDVNNRSFLETSEFCAGTIPMEGNPKRENDVLVVACIGNKLFSGTKEKSGKTTYITPVANLGYPCVCNAFTKGVPTGILIDLSKQWQNVKIPIE